MLIDMHVHSVHTRGCSLSVADLVARAKQLGLSGLVITDINTLEGLSEVRGEAERQSFLALCGAELTTDRGNYLCYFPDLEIVPSPPQALGTPPWPVRDAIRWVSDQGGAVVAAHPYDKSSAHSSGDFIFTLDGLHGVEAWNALKKSSVNELAMEAADHMGLACVGSSGAPDSLEGLGKAATLFRDPVRNEADLVAQLKAGSVYPVAIGSVPANAAQSRYGASQSRSRDRSGPPRRRR